MKDKQKTIRWKTVTVETYDEDGTLLKGEITYWPKDYTISLKEPFESKGCGAHMLYCVPAIYITDEEVRSGVKGINLLDRAKDLLPNIYKKRKLEEQKDEGKS